LIYCTKVLFPILRSPDPKVDLVHNYGGASSGDVMTREGVLKASRVICGTAALIVAFAARAEDCGKLTEMKLPHAIVTSAEQTSTEGATKIAYCRVRATSKPTTDSDIRIEVWIPLGSAWNGKFEQVGNGGFAGVIPSGRMARVVALGYAVAGTDDGHQAADNTDASWALNHEEKIKDFGWRAISETTLISKRIIQEFKSKTPAKAYFVGCSDGGREALMMAQRFPRYFDGIVAGAPANAMTRLLSSGAVRNARLGSVDGHMSSAKLALLQASVLKSCGNGARYLKDPLQCRPDPASLKCAGAETDSCLTDAQIATAQAIYQEQKDPLKGTRLYGVLPGAEAVKGSWDAWLMGTDDGQKPAGLGYTRSYFANLVMRDPHFDLAKVTDEDIARGERQYAPILDASDPDLSAFKSHGGKLIQYHGWNDPGIPPGFSVEYHARVAATIGKIDGFYRLYMVPGMLHCGGGDAPTTVDWQSAIEAWVEKDTPPGALTAGEPQGGTQTLLPFAANAYPAPP
jgi:pimeloyl-ACP methyl ester carboxylesterase